MRRDHRLINAFLSHPSLSRRAVQRDPSPLAGFESSSLPTANELPKKIKRNPVYKPIRNVETLEHYVRGGYHPVMIGDVFRDRYRVVDKLGFSHYHTLWLAHDTHLKRYVTLKICTADAPPQVSTILGELAVDAPVPAPASQGRASLPLPLDEFELRGPNGIHSCYTTPLATTDLRKIMYRRRLFPVDVARALAGRVTLAVAYMHERGYAHGDVGPRNILIRPRSGLNDLSVDELYEEYGEPEIIPITHCEGEPLPENIPSSAVAKLNFGEGVRADYLTLADTHIHLIDFAGAYSPLSSPCLGKACSSPRSLRPPESRFDPNIPLSYSADIWSLALTIWEILGGKTLFSHEATTLDPVTAHQNDILGPMPKSWWGRWENKRMFFESDGRPWEDREVRPSLERSFEESIQELRRRRPKTGVFENEEAEAILGLLRSMLVFFPEERITALEVLESEWMKKWVLPEVERSQRGAEDEEKESHNRVEEIPPGRDSLIEGTAHKNIRCFSSGARGVKA